MTALTCDKQWTNGGTFYNRKLDPSVGNYRERFHIRYAEYLADNHPPGHMHHMGFPAAWWHIERRLRTHFPDITFTSFENNKTVWADVVRGIPDPTDHHSDPSLRFPNVVWPGGTLIQAEVSQVLRLRPADFQTREAYWKWVEANRATCFWFDYCCTVNPNVVAMCRNVYRVIRKDADVPFAISFQLGREAPAMTPWINAHGGSLNKPLDRRGEALATALEASTGRRVDLTKAWQYESERAEGHKHGATIGTVCGIIRHGQDQDMSRDENDRIENLDDPQQIMPAEFSTRARRLVRACEDLAKFAPRLTGQEPPAPIDLRHGAKGSEEAMARSRKGMQTLYEKKAQARKTAPNTAEAAMYTTDRVMVAIHLYPAYSYVQLRDQILLRNGKFGNSVRRLREREFVETARRPDGTVYLKLTPEGRNAALFLLEKFGEEAFKLPLPTAADKQNV
jgi:hypothetical protein